MSLRVPRRLLAVALSTALLAAACSNDSDTKSSTASTSGSSATAGSASYTAAGSIRQAYVLDAEPGAKLTLVGPAGDDLATEAADAMGSLIFRDLEPGDGYVVRSGDDTDAVASKAFSVLSEDETPDPAVYDQSLKAGLNYVTMRDGVELAMTVRLPPGKELSDGPFPTVIEYSGYQVAAPHDLLSTVLGGKDDPLAPASSTAVGSLIAPQLGFAAVSVQMRGSGCSGGDFDLFGLPTIFDGYDAVETVATQPWVKGGKVGMVGISFSGITQVLVGGTRPPHLAAITPLSVTDDLYTGTGYPGGIRNSGFAASWIAERQNDAKPAPAGGQPWAVALTKDGDKHCLANQKLRLQTQDANGLMEGHPYRDPELYEQRAPGYWAKRIEVPTYLVGAFQDEQTSGHFSEMIPDLQGDDVYVTLTNGTHVDSLGPASITRWAEFLDLFLADETPSVPATITSLSDALYLQIASAPAMKLPAVRFADLDPEAGRDAFRKETPRVRVLFDNGGGEPALGALAPQWELGLDQFPPTDVEATRWFLGGGGTLKDAAAKGDDASESYTPDPAARPEQTLHGQPDGDAWLALPNYDWKPVAKGKALAYESAPLTGDIVMAGPASADLYVRSSAADTDLQVTISEVRPDGQEMYVQTGWLRASHRALDVATSTELDPRPTHLEADAQDLTADEFTLLRVPIVPFAHAFRKGTRVRITIQAPGGDRAIWKFATVEDGTTTNDVGVAGEIASSIVLPVVPGAKAGGPLPPCPSNRGQPCRAYQLASNERPSS